MQYHVDRTLTHAHIHAADFGSKAIGHFGSFKKCGEEKLWPGSVARMAGMCTWCQGA
jgi:hypothetical protein